MDTIAFQAEMEALHKLIRDNICKHIKGLEPVDLGCVSFSVKDRFVEVTICKRKELEDAFYKTKRKLEPKTRTGEMDYMFWVELDHFRWTGNTIGDAFAKAKASVELIVSEFNITQYEIEQKESQIWILQREIKELKGDKDDQDEID